MASPWKPVRDSHESLVWKWMQWSCFGGLRRRRIVGSDGSDLQDCGSSFEEEVAAATGFTTLL